MMQNGRTTLGRPQILYGMDPVTLGAGSLAMSAASTGFNIFSSLTGQSAQAEAAAKQQSWGVYQAQVQAAVQAAQARWEQALATQRKELAQRAVDDSIQRGQVAESVVRLKGAQDQGSARARLAGQGTDFSGSAVDVYGDVAAANEFDALTVRSNAAREAYGHKLEIVDAENAYALAKAKDDNARPGLVNTGYSGSNYGAVGSALAGASDLASKWWKFQQAGAFDWGSNSPLANVSGFATGAGPRGPSGGAL